MRRIMPQYNGIGQYGLPNNVKEILTSRLKSVFEKSILKFNSNSL